ncbi:hypothetical protein V8F20_004128 [Naviculisporaceae sp. PSN 640]
MLSSSCQRLLRPRLPCLSPKILASRIPDSTHCRNPTAIAHTLQLPTHCNCPHIVRASPSQPIPQALQPWERMRFAVSGRTWNQVDDMLSQWLIPPPCVRRLTKWDPLQRALGVNEPSAVSFMNGVLHSCICQSLRDRLGQAHPLWTFNCSKFQQLRCHHVGDTDSSTPHRPRSLAVSMQAVQPAPDTGTLVGFRPAQDQEISTSRTVALLALTQHQWAVWYFYLVMVDIDELHWLP